LQGQSLSGDSFTSLKQLQDHIDAYVNAYNDRAKPFVWTKKKSPSTPFQRPPYHSALILDTSARVIESNGRRIGYVHVWCYAGSIHQRALEHLLSQGALKDADALIWDLRDGWGGA